MFGHSVFNPVSPQGLAISNFFIFTIIAALIIVLGITATLVYTVVRFRHRPGQGEPPQEFGVVKLEIAWMVGPFLLIAVIFGATVSTMRLAAPGSDPPADLTVIGHQWWWELRYPSGVVSANEIHIPVGKRLLVALQSTDVIHSFWVPQLGPKMDLVPAQTNHLWLEADKPGVYEGECTEFCGGPHAWMLLKVIAQPPAQFAAWQQAQLRQAATPATSLARQGAAVFLQNTCQVCHAIYGNGATRATDLRQTVIAPNLTHVGSRTSLAAGRLANTPATMTAWLAQPDVFKPGVHMPDMHLSAAQLRALTAYLESLQ